MALTVATLADLQYARQMAQGSIIGFMLDFSEDSDDTVELSSPKQGYFVGPLNVDKLLDPIKEENDWDVKIPIGSYPTSFYVDDSPEEFIEKYDQIIQDADERVAVFFSPMTRANQPAEGGWRWHKWGEYLGKHEPKHEYLYDEEDIERIYVVTIKKVKF